MSLKLRLCAQMRHNGKQNQEGKKTQIFPFVFYKNFPLGSKFYTDYVSDQESMVTAGKKVDHSVVS